MTNELYEYIQANNLDTSDVEALLGVLQGVTVKQYVAKSVVNNYIVTNSLNLKLRDVVNTPYVENGPNDTVIPGTGFLTKRLVAQAGLDWLMTNNIQQDGQPEMVNPDNANLQNLIGLTQAVGIYTADEVGDFWSLFETPRFPNLTTEQVQAALNTPKIEAVRALYEPARATADAYEQAMLALQSNDYERARSELAKNGVDLDEL